MKERLNICAMQLMAGLLFSSPVWGKDYYVSTSGSDSNDGSLEAPFLTLSNAQEVVRSDLTTASEPINVWLRGGTYYLGATLEFGTADSGSASVPVTYAGYSNETVVISGALTFTPTWSTYSGDILVADIGRGLIFDMLFVNNELQVMARYPDYDPDVSILNGYASDAISSTKVSGWADPAGGFVRGLHGSEWGGNSYRITGKSGSSLNMEWVGDNNRGSGLHSTYRMVENIFEELDAPGEWFYDESAGKVYFYPPAGLDPNTATFEGASLEELIRVVGDASKKVKYLTFSNLTFSHTHRTLFTGTYEAMNRSDWRLVRAGAIYVKDAENITISDSIFDRVGGNAVFFSDYNRNHLVTNNEFLDNGATCVNVCGSKNALWNTNEWDDYPETTNEVVNTAGPKTDDYPKNITISYNYMYNLGRFEKQTAGVNLFIAKDITISHNTIHHCPRAGLNICDGSWGGHIIEFNDIFDCIRETHDHGPFNSWGRDRFYSIGGYNHSGSDGAIKRPYAFLDAQKTTIIRNNRFHYEEPTQFGIDLDDGSSNYEIYNNLILNTSVKLREGFSRKVYNNIIINRGLDLHVWFAECRDSISNNIVVGSTAYNPISVGGSDEEAYTDYNLFFNGDNDVVVDSFNWIASDEHSVIANPLFLNPQSNDYTVAEGSPALDIGFVNFPMDQFGRPGSPEPGPISYDGGIPPGSDAEPFMGASISSIYDDGIQSVLGAPDHNGVFFESLPYGSYAQTESIEQYDLIRVMNGTDITTKQSFWLLYNSIPSGSTISCTIIRNQAEEAFSFDKTTGYEQLNQTAGLLFTGTWSNQLNVSCYNSDVHTTSAAGDAFELTFYGTDVSFEAIKGPSMGTVEVYIDGVLDQSVSLYDSSEVFQETVYSRGSLEKGVHTLRVVNGAASMNVDSVHVGIIPTLNWQVSTSQSAEASPPSFSTNDLAQTHVLSTSATGGESVAERHGDLFNGIIGDSTSGTSDPGAVRMNSDNTITVTLDTETYPNGFDITGIDTIFGWDTGNGGRSNQGYELILSFVDGTITSLAGPEHWEPNSPASYWTKVSFTASATNGIMASGVKAITFDITQNANASGVLIGREFDVFGSPIRGEVTPVAHWKMDEGSGTLVSDCSGNGHDGSLVHGSWIPDQLGGAIDFDGTNSLVSIPASAFNTIGNQVSIALWTYGGDLQPVDNSIFYAVDSSNNRLLNIHLPFSNGTVYWDAGDATGKDRINKGATAEQYKAAWNHWVFTKNASTGDMQIYWNGVLWHSGTGTVKPIGEVSEAYIGAWEPEAFFYDGMIGDVQLYDMALTADEVRALYQDMELHVPVLESNTVVSNGNMHAQFSGTLGYPYQVESTEDLTTNEWSVVSTISSLEHSPFEVAVPATNDATFLRVVIP